MTVDKWQQFGELDISRDLLTKKYQETTQLIERLRAHLEMCRSLPLSESDIATLTLQQHEFDDLVRDASDQLQRIEKLQARERRLSQDRALLRLEQQSGRRSRNRINSPDSLRKS